MTTKEKRLTEALGLLVNYITSGAHYESTNPYGRPAVLHALTVLSEVRGISQIYDAANGYNWEVLKSGPLPLSPRVGRPRTRPHDPAKGKSCMCIDCRKRRTQHNPDLGKLKCPCRTCKMERLAMAKLATRLQEEKSTIY